MWEIGIRKVNFVVIRPHRLAVCWDGFIRRIRTEGSLEPNLVVFVLQAWCVTQQNLKLVNDLCKCVLKCDVSLYRTMACHYCGFFLTQWYILIYIDYYWKAVLHSGKTTLLVKTNSKSLLDVGLHNFTIKIIYYFKILVRHW